MLHSPLFTNSRMQLKATFYVRMITSAWLAGFTPNVKILYVTSYWLIEFLLTAIGNHLQ